ncbi:Na(+)-translocating NADH-quinone reductase subunit C [Neisseriaceae bacterium PsAf]|nr:Na(+)-translocating NADH-quinone reductase subunit C [Neisseriaceae bacterium PsAf]
MFDKDSVKGTMTVVILLSLICSIIVSASAVFLKPKQLEQKELDKYKNVLMVAQLYEPDSDTQQIFDEKIETRYVDLNTGLFVEKPKNYDALQFAKNPDTSTVLSEDQDLAKIRTRANVVEVYLVKGDKNNIKEIILPIYGNGLWSMMYAFIGVSLDGNTITGLTYYDQGETPGLGGEVENPQWSGQFIDKKIYDESGNFAIKVAKNASNLSSEHGIDALSGATLTSRGVQNTFSFWFGDLGYKKFLEHLEEGKLNYE